MRSLKFSEKNIRKKIVRTSRDVRKNLKSVRKNFMSLLILFHDLYILFRMIYLYIQKSLKMQNKETASLEEWTFEFGEGGLSPSAYIDALTEQCKLFRAPSIIFGNNYMELANKSMQFKMVYNVEQALKYLNFQVRNSCFYDVKQASKKDGICYLPKKLQIKHAQKWKDLAAPKEIQISQIQEGSDSFFVTPFKGKVSGNYEIQKVNESVIPIHKLGENNTIHFYKQGSIYEDELDDNGLIQYEYKFRSMAESWFALIRCYVRVDDVIIQILDTRLFWEKGWQKIARQFMVKECSWENLKNKGFETLGGWSTNPHQSHIVYEHLDEILVQNQYIHIK